MSEIRFYHLQGQPLEKALPTLLSMSLERGWRCVVQAGSQERLEALDAVLWTYSDDSFLPHGVDSGGFAAEQPVLLTLSGEPAKNGAKVRFLVDSLPMPSDLASLDRLVVMFDGNDADAVDHARVLWKQAKATAATCSYWQQGDGGRWAQKA